MWTIAIPAAVCQPLARRNMLGDTPWWWRKAFANWAAWVADLAADGADRQVGCLKQPRGVLHAYRGELVAKGAAGELGEHALELALGRGDLARDVA